MNPNKSYRYITLSQVVDDYLGIITEDAEYEILPSTPLLEKDPNVLVDQLIQDKIDNQ
jgi:hypothetical protein